MKNTRHPKPNSRPKRTSLAGLRVRALVTDPSRGQLIAGAAVIPCALGRSGIKQAKREGDGASPRGTFRLRGGVYRPDHFASRPVSPLPVRPSAPGDGWCDDARDRRYNRPIRLPAPGVGHERMWREDGLYDLVVVVGYNDDPPEGEWGSAIFLHVAREDYAPTRGCVAFSQADLLELVPLIGPETRVRLLTLPASEQATAPEAEAKALEDFDEKDW